MSATGKAPLIGKKVNRFKNAFTKLRAVSVMMGEQVSLFGDVTAPSSDGSGDALGGGLALRATAMAMMEPQDQIGHMREQDPVALKAAITQASAESGQKRWASLPAEEVARQLYSGTENGLTSAKAADLLETYGRNELAKGKSVPFIVVWFYQLKDAVALIICLASIINFIKGDRSTGLMMFSYFWVSTFINAIGEYSSAEGMSALSAMGADACKVLRDGVEKEIPPAELVPGDIAVLAYGDTVPADMRVITCTDLRLDEALLTGESEEVSKIDGPLPPEQAESFPTNMLFSSTSVVAGKCTAVVTATGMEAQVGLIAKRLEVGLAGLSPLQRTMNRLGGCVGVVVVFVTILITLVCFLRKFQEPDNLCDPDDNKCFLLGALGQGIILGISCVPVTMPMMTTLLLNTARREITLKSAVVRKTSSIEMLGCCMVICSDKTGTLTEGKMTVIKAVTPRAEATNSFCFYPTKGCDPAGGIFLESDLDGAKKSEIDAYLKKNAYIKDNCPVKCYGGSKEPKDIEDAHVRTLMAAASLNCYATTLQQAEGKWVTVGNLSEGALVVGAAKAGMGAAVEGLELLDVRDQFPADVDAEVPFTSARKMMCTVHAVSKGSFVNLALGNDQSHVAVVKGAPDRLLPMVQRTLVGDSSGKLSFRDGFDTKMHEAVMEQNTRMAEDSLRVLLLCIRALTEAEVAKLRKLEADDRMDMVTQNLAIVGAFGILDPPRQTVKASISRCKSAGIRVVMITGDQPPTAAAIGLSLDIVQDKKQARLCAELHDQSGDLLPEDQIDKMVRETNVWARAQPADKVSIVESLQRMGYPSAMTGDGVNDAPALKLSDIGTAMGVTGTAVAKGAADLVLMNDDFTTIVDAVEEGRRTYANVQSYVAFYLSMCLPEVVMYGTCLVVGIPMPLTQLQMLGMNGIAHVIPPLTYAFQPLTDEAMHVPPRRKDSKLVPKATLIWIVVPWLIFFLTAWLSLNAYGYYKHTGFVFMEDIVAHEGIRQVEDNNPFVSDEDPLKVEGLEPVKFSQDESSRVHKGVQIARTMNFLMVCIAELLLTLAVSTEKPFAIFRTPNKKLKIAAISCGCVAFFAVYIGHFVPKLIELTRLVPLRFDDLCIVLGFAAVVHVLFEFTKIGYRNDTRTLIELRRYHALATKKGLLSVTATDAEVEACRTQHPMSELTAML